MKRVIILTPLVLFLVLALLFYRALGVVPSPISKTRHLPTFELTSPYEGTSALRSEDIKGKYSLINIFASWCAMCQVEHPLLVDLKEQGVPIYGIAWKDEAKDTLEMLEKLGNPYTSVGTDLDGTVALALGITGAPETFVIDPDGKIIYRFAGVLTEEMVKEEILPRLKIEKKEEDKVNREPEHETEEKP
ncbi:MAG: DsbE family thiol:disulfide interchange protein [Rickettsiales bacterium]|jgi:cytochrome c biogenesis protein CcmG/thiol:disulfide interchange protein DsbE|nr:DsbE family thiol:disulfide interchange protein [Rickettsiales bacterium]